MAYFQFLGTGPSTPITDATGRNYRRRSAGLMHHIATYVLIDATHDLDEQVEVALTVTAVVVTNGSRDAAGGLGNLDRWLDARTPLYAPASLYAEVAERYGPFERIYHEPIKAYEPTLVGDLSLTCFPVETTPGDAARDNYGYHFDTGKKRVTYASDVKLIPERSEPFFANNDLLIVDGAGWDKDLPTHRGVLNHLPAYVAAGNELVRFTDIGRAAPPHSEASRRVARVYPRAELAYDFMKIPLGR